MNDTEVALASLALLGTCMGAIIWMAKYSMRQLSVTLKAHTRAADKQTQASREQVSASKEVLAFMKNLNGKLAKATIQTVQEQTVEHQTVQETHRI